MICSQQGKIPEGLQDLPRPPQPQIARLHLRHKRLHWIASVPFFFLGFTGIIHVRWWDECIDPLARAAAAAAGVLSSLCALWYSKWMKRQQLGGQIISGYQTMPQRWHTHTRAHRQTHRVSVRAHIHVCMPQICRPSVVFWISDKPG